MTAARSTTGCWTCRIRKKKCDDARPACAACSLRHLTCHGYGAKPSWMESAEGQKAEVQKIKRAVSESYKARRAFRVTKVSGPNAQSPVPNKAANSVGRNVSPESRDIYQAGKLNQGMPITNTPPLDQTERDRDEFANAVVGPWPEASIPSRLAYRPHRQDYPDPSRNVAGPRYGSLAQEGIEAARRFSSHPEAPAVEKEHDLNMIMNYLDNIFPLRFYFYLPSTTERGRGWLLSLVLKAKASYFAALTFSVVHQLIFVYSGDVVMEEQLSRDLDRYHSLTMGELQRQLDYLPTVTGPRHLKIGVEILACMMELMSIEIFRETKSFRGPKGDWEVHLRAAGVLLPIIGTDLRISSTALESSSGADEDTPPASDTELRPSPHGFLPLDEIAGLDFFTTCYVWSDIFRRASLRLDPSDQDPFPYLTYLKEDRIRLDRIMGCRNWVMATIREISDLEAWKNEMQSRGILSIPMLSRRASVLEDRLDGGLNTLSKDFGGMATYDRECRHVTEIYALSALVYLAVVVSGNFHSLPEVRYNVRRTISALKALPPHLLIRVSWAFCVAGCMAGDGEKDDLKQILVTASEKGHPLGTLWNGLEIMEEFWKMREILGPAHTRDSCAWAAAMENLGTKILLI